MSQTTTAFAHALDFGASGFSAARPADRTISARPRWIPRYAIGTGTLVGAECIVGSRCHAFPTDGARSLDAPAISPIRADLDAAMRLVDELLLRGRPLPLSVPISSGDLADPELLARLRNWSIAHGGAHRLLELEIDVAGFHRRSADVWLDLATLGYEVTLCRATTVGPEARELGVSRLAFPQSLIRRAVRDPRVASTIKSYAERAHAQGLEPVIKGLAAGHGLRLRDLVCAGSWQPTTAVVSLDAEELYLQVCAHMPRRHPWRGAAGTAGRRWDGWDLTWTASRPPAPDRDVAVGDRSSDAQALLDLGAALGAVAAGHLDTVVPGTERADEIGDVARAFARLRDLRAAADLMRIEQGEAASIDDVRAFLADLAETDGEGAAASSRRLRAREHEVVWWLTRVAGCRDDGSGAHNVRMGRISRILAEAIGLPDADCRMIEIAAQMHDVGKIGIPDEILFKPGRLTPEERGVMETHALLGWDILRGCQSPLIRLAADIAVSHHEKWDGTGYPHRLAGEAIPVVGRICALADVFDALMAQRHYKAAWSLDRTVAHIAENVGRHFDPRCVEAFFARFDDIVAVVRAAPASPDSIGRGEGQTSLRHRLS